MDQEEGRQCLFVGTGVVRCSKTIHSVANFNLNSSIHVRRIEESVGQLDYSQSVSRFCNSVEMRHTETRKQHATMTIKDRDTIYT